MSKCHVFISYASENSQQVKLLAQALEKCGERVWYDEHPQRGLAGGQDWEAEIEQKIRESYAVVICFSQELEDRPGGEAVVYKETRNAIDVANRLPPEAVFIVPVRLSDCRIPNFRFDSTRTFSNLKYLDLFGNSADYVSNLNRLLRGVRSSPLRPRNFKRLEMKLSRDRNRATMKPMQKTSLEEFFEVFYGLKADYWIVTILGWAGIISVVEFILFLVSKFSTDVNEFSIHSSTWIFLTVFWFLFRIRQLNTPLTNQDIGYFLRPNERKEQVKLGNDITLLKKHVFKLQSNRKLLLREIKDRDETITDLVTESTNFKRQNRRLWVMLMVCVLGAIALSALLLFHVVSPLSGSS